MMIMEKYSKHIMIVLIVIILGQFFYLKWAVNSTNEIKLEYQKQNQDREEKILEDSAAEILEIKKKTQDTINKLLQLDAEIIIKPYEKRIYINRIPDSAVVAMQRARKRYNIQ